ncbi:hypothetical protein A3K73_01695 [Candidatus Pacearchaeota archaeon RBG_13_36_9]|nr:MAG: hypothetical protein A3K73_01695 [Candidatus Pacearchaeota archaeon RBG_13_36_9]
MKVSVVKCNSYKGRELREALEKSLENLGFSFKKNMKVLIKPNILSPHPPETAITTNPLVIEELCKILKKYNADIYIGESSSYETKKGFEVSGIGKLEKYAKIINFETQDKQLFKFKGIKEVPLPKIIFEMDLIINVAKLKTHLFTGATLCVKNLYGCIPGMAKSYYHKVLPSLEGFSKFLLELHEKIKPGLNIIDGVVGLEGMGPGLSGKPIKSNLIIAGNNAIAADIIGSEIMGFKPDSIYTNRFSGMQRDEIEVVGQRYSLNFKKPPMSLFFKSPIFNSLEKLFPKSKIVFDYDKCKKCHLCEKKCPVQAIKLGPFPKCNYQECIRCVCCIEVCPQKAIVLKEHWTKTYARAIVRKVFKS